MQGSEKFKVAINLYDLSGGMAKQFSPILLGKTIEGIWHTGIIVYGIEYYFGGGILTGAPGKTPYGSPLLKIDLGETEIPQAIFEEFLQGKKSQFNYSTYDLLKNNCNNFCDECAKFLLDKGIPDYIVGLPEEVLNSPIGGLLRPMIQQMQQSIIQQSEGGEQFIHNQSSQNSNQAQINQEAQKNALKQQESSVLKQSVLQNVPKLDQPLNLHKARYLTSLEEYIDEQSQHDRIIINFFDDLIPPCDLIKPIFCEYSNKYEEIKFFLVNARECPDIIEACDITSYPTFLTIYKSSEFKTWVSANQTVLKDKIEKFLQKQ